MTETTFWLRSSFDFNQAKHTKDGKQKAKKLLHRNETS